MFFSFFSFVLFLFFLFIPFFFLPVSPFLFFHFLFSFIFVSPISSLFFIFNKCSGILKMFTFFKFCPFFKNVPVLKLSSKIPKKKKDFQILFASFTENVSKLIKLEFHISKWFAFIFRSIESQCHVHARPSSLDVNSLQSKDPSSLDVNTLQSKDRS